MSNRMVAFTGFRYSGKDTAAKVLIEQGYENVKFAGALKDMLRAVLRWSGCPANEVERWVEGDRKERGCKWLSADKLRDPDCHKVMVRALIEYQTGRYNPLEFTSGSRPRKWFAERSLNYVLRTLETWADVWTGVEYQTGVLGIFPTGKITPRHFMQTIGTEWGRHVIAEDFWVRVTMERVRRFEKVVITDCRFPNEVDAVRRQGGMVIRISRSEITDKTSLHASEAGIAKLHYDFMIYNTLSIEDLHETVLFIVQNERV